MDRSKLLLITGMLLWLLTGCGEEAAAPEQHALRLKLAQQVDLSCRAGGTYHKTVKDLLQLDNPPEHQQMTLAVDSSKQPACLLHTELEYALAYCYDEPAVAEFFHTEHREDTLLAVPLPAYEAQSELKLQKIWLDGQSGYIRYLESRIEKHSWLYQSAAHIQVAFDSLGRYESHQLEIETKIAFIRHHFHAHIEGHCIYE